MHAYIYFFSINQQHLLSTEKKSGKEDMVKDWETKLNRIYTHEGKNLAD